MKYNGILKPGAKESVTRSVDKTGSELKIGNTTAKVWPDTEYKSKVPHVLFYNIQQV